MQIEPATEADVEPLLPLIRSYCDFYEVDPPDAGLLEMERALIAAPDDEGLLLVARRDGDLVGFAACGWKWSSLRAARFMVLEDLFVVPEARGEGLADALINACADRARAHGAPCLAWTTAVDNHRAQAVYNRIGAVGETWMEYELELTPSD
jgi:GNAT superfamily N-acetyltransferase